MSDDYIALAEEHEARLAELRASADRDAALRELHARVVHLLARLDAERLEKLAIWHVDHCYRLINRIDGFDGLFLAYFAALTRPLWSALTARGRSIAYLVDNEVPEDRLLGTKHLFNAMGMVVASPEVLVEDLGGDMEEATAVAQRLYEQCVVKGTPVLWISGELDLPAVQALGHALDGMPCAGVFRNTAPVDGSKVLVFRDVRGQVEIVADY